LKAGEQMMAFAHRPNNRLLMAMAVSAFVSACTVGPDFVRPDAKAPSGWTTEPPALPMSNETSGTTPTPVAIKWWMSFKDPALTTLIERAAASNFDLRQAVLRIDEARAQRGIAGAALDPSLSANGSYTRERLSEKSALTSLLGGFTNGSGQNGGPSGGITPGPPIPNPFDQFQYGFDASWEVDLFGRVRRSVEAADADLAVTIEDSRDVLISLDGDIARTYFDLRDAQARKKLLEENLAAQRVSFDLARDRHQAGLANALDMANAGAQVTSTQALIPLEISRITRDINQLSVLLGLEPGALQTELSRAVAPPSVPPQVSIGLPADLIRRRPDIRAAEAQLHAATARVGVAVADLFPRLTVNADVGFQAQRFGDLGNWGSRFFSIGPNIEVPIFSGGRRQATVRLEDAKAKEAGVAYARTVLTAFHDVENALAAYGQEQSRRASLESTVAQNRDAFTLAQQRYASGVTSFLDVLDAERTLQQNELALADSTTAVATNLVILYKALGGGWELQLTTSVRGAPMDNRSIANR
jgi:outer membrane protein, multidrug efflux system